MPFNPSTVWFGTTAPNVNLSLSLLSPPLLVCVSEEAPSGALGPREGYAARLVNELSRPVLSLCSPFEPCTEQSDIARSAAHGVAVAVAEAEAEGESMGVEELGNDEARKDMVGSESELTGLVSGSSGKVGEAAIGTTEGDKLRLD